MKLKNLHLFLVLFVIAGLIISASEAATNKKNQAINSSAKAGIKLLDDIFKRIHNEPQLAMSRTDELRQGSPSQLDLNLAIKPKESGRLNLANAPALKLLPSQLTNSALSEKLAREESNDLKGIANSPAGGTAQNSIDTWMGSAKQENVRQRNPGLWEKDSQLAQSPYVSEPALEQAKSKPSITTTTAPSLGSSANKLYQLANKLDASQKEQTPIVAPSPSSAPKPISLARPLPAKKIAQVIADKEISPAEGKIALLPPNVVTGIPLISLGVSEAQASSSLSELGHLDHEKLNNWTIWSWYKDTNSSTCALQLFMKHGLLEAMRIHDSSLISPGFGISLGDSLAKVKEKFGEPAFIIGEPESGNGQNYIYPISQVGFQLARTNPNDTPKVISVLIFNVK
jgi:hypothetical protein